MQLITVAGSPSVGKTSVILRVAELLRRDGLKVGIAKFDSLSTSDDKLYEQKGFPVATGLSGALCPDHYFVSNIEDCWAWGQRQQLDLARVAPLGQGQAGRIRDQRHRALAKQTF